MINVHIHAEHGIHDPNWQNFKVQVARHQTIGDVRQKLGEQFASHWHVSNTKFYHHDKNLQDDTKISNVISNFNNILYLNTEPKPLGTGDYKIQRVVGSLTTLPSRIEFLEETVKSILAQKYKLDVLYLNIPYTSKKGQPYLLSSYLTNLNNKHVILNRCKDYGSITKILPTLELEKDPDTLIITFDDDMIYDENLVLNLVEGARKYNDGCVGMGGWILGSFPFMYQSVHDAEGEVDWLEGKTAVAYPRKYLPSNALDLLNNPFPAELGQHDDHIITYNIAQNGARRYVIDGRAKSKERLDVRGLDGISSDALKYLSQVRKITAIMKKEGLYVQDANVTSTYGFKVLFILLIVVIIIIAFVYVARRK